MLIYGVGFIKNQHLMVRLSKDTAHKLVKPVYKSSRKLAIELPDMGSEGVEIGTHPITVEVTTNGQQFTACGVTFQYNQVDPNLTDEDIRKMEEEEAKAAKKGGAKKK